MRLLPALLLIASTVRAQARPRARDLGVGRLGGTGGNPSGDIFVAFSTANPGAAKPDANVTVTMLPNERLRAALRKYNRLVEPRR